MPCSTTSPHPDRETWPPTPQRRPDRHSGPDRQVGDLDHRVGVPLQRHQHRRDHRTGLFVVRRVAHRHRPGHPRARHREDHQNQYCRRYDIALVTTDLTATPQEIIARYAQPTPARGRAKGTATPEQETSRRATQYASSHRNQTGSPGEYYRSELWKAAGAFLMLVGRVRDLPVSSHTLTRPAGQHRLRAALP
jgi:hypothetical protein